MSFAGPYLHGVHVGTPPPVDYRALANLARVPITNVPQITGWARDYAMADCDVGQKQNKKHKIAKHEYGSQPNFGVT